jgi:hypothetical protein
MKERHLLHLLLAGCLVFGTVIFSELRPAGTEDPAVGEAPTRPQTASDTRREQNPRIDELLTEILARPLFSSDRRPSQGAADTAVDSDLADTRLTGIVTEPDRRLAIFAVNGDKPLRVTEGDAVSGWRIESITPREVSLSAPRGTKTLQPKMDPNLAPPPGQPPMINPGGRPPTPPVAAGAVRPPVPPVALGARPPTSAVPVKNPGVPPRPRG